jgi:hypothetical protein
MHQATCLAAQDSCSIAVPVHFSTRAGRKIHNFRLAPGTTVGDLENKIIAENIFEEFNGWDSLRPTKSLQHLEDILEESQKKKPGTVFAADPRHVCQEGEAYAIKPYAIRRFAHKSIGVFVAMKELVGNRNMPVVPAAHCPGTQWLLHPEPPSDVRPDDVSAVAHACGGSDNAQFIPDCDSLAAVSPAACQSLRILVERAHAHASSSGSFAPDQLDGMNSTQLQVISGSCKSDFKMLLCPQQLLNIIGAAAYNDIIAALQVAVPDAIVLRRTVATGRFIAFHTDHAARTVQVPLNHDSSCVGGRLLFAFTNGKLMLAQRRQGHVLVHDGDAAHGVTRLIKGVRLGLYALRARCNDDD